jgi:hypothetical protein
MSAFSPAAVLRNVLRLVTPVAVALTIYLYLYPVFSRCGFPLPPAPSSPSQDDGQAIFVETARQHAPNLVQFLEEKLSKDSIASLPRKHAPFRLLALGDPQLEGDTSIPDLYIGFFPHTRDFFKHITFQSSHWNFKQRVRWVFHDFIDIFFEDIFNSLESIRKRIDLFGNDFYMAHIYRTVHWWSKPTHVTVLGDLVGSQWLPDDDFERRGVRYWNRVFKGGERVPDDIAAEPAEEYDLAGFIGSSASNKSDAEAWTRRIINVAGNHDIGYAGDITVERMERFERIFGKPNYELRFELPLVDLKDNSSLLDPDQNPNSDKLPPELRVVVLNDMNLDTPAASIDLQDMSYEFINKVINTATAVEYRGHFTVILTHVPMYKPEGICVDKPFFDFHEHDGTLKEQNQLSADASKGFLEGIFGMSGNPDAPGRGRGRPGVILNGHDHAGCDTYHFINQTADANDQPAVEVEGETEGAEEHEEGQRPEKEDQVGTEPGWQVQRWEHARDAHLPNHPDMPGLREITVRSMMGDFGGNAGLLSLWFDEDTWEWQFEFATCPLGRQHLWWTVHLLDLSLVAVAIAYVVIVVLNARGVDADGWIVENLSMLGTWAVSRLREAAQNTRLGRRALALAEEQGNGSKVQKASTEVSDIKTPKPLSAD